MQCRVLSRFSGYMWLHGELVDVNGDGMRSGKVVQGVVTGGMHVGVMVAGEEFMVVDFLGV